MYSVQPGLNQSGVRKCVRINGIGVIHPVVQHLAGQVQQRWRVFGSLYDGHFFPILVHVKKHLRRPCAKLDQTVAF